MLSARLAISPAYLKAVPPKPHSRSIVCMTSRQGSLILVAALTCACRGSNKSSNSSRDHRHIWSDLSARIDRISKEGKWEPPWQNHPYPMENFNSGGRRVRVRVDWLIEYDTPNPTQQKKNPGYSWSLLLPWFHPENPNLTFSVFHSSGVEVSRYGLYFCDLQWPSLQANLCSTCLTALSTSCWRVVVCTEKIESMGWDKLPCPCLWWIPTKPGSERELGSNCCKARATEKTS